VYYKELHSVEYVCVCCKLLAVVAAAGVAALEVGDVI
jgi:hypothetical protein